MPRKCQIEDSGTAPAIKRERPLPTASIAQPRFDSWLQSAQTKLKQKNRMTALISITTGNLSQASPMIAPIMADVKPLGLGYRLSGRPGINRRI